MRHILKLAVATLAIGALSTWAAPVSAQSPSDMAGGPSALMAKSAYSAQSEHQAKAKRSAAQHRPPANYYSPTNPRGYDYGYRYPGGVDTMTTGSIFVPRPATRWGQEGPASGQSWIAYCSAKYQTYDATSNTFWGRDGRQHICQ